MRKITLIGNWKMHFDLQASQALAKKIRQSDMMDILLAPSFTNLAAVNEIIKDTQILLAGQNMHYAEEGAFTGEISAEMLKDVGCEYVMLGHSERRQFFGETYESVNKKVMTALENNLKVIFCIGETREERDTGKVDEVLENQIATGLKKVKNFQNIIVAYEPVWAIGGSGEGTVATPEMIEEVHALVRENFEEIFDKEISKNMKILYGGSVNPDNGEDLICLDDVDGFLVGGASLKAESFNAIIEMIEKCGVT